MSVVPIEAERHTYANSSDRVVKAPIASRVWVELQPGEQVTYWTDIGQGVARRRRARRRRTWIVVALLSTAAVVGCAIAAASLYVRSQLG